MADAQGPNGRTKETNARRIAGPRVDHGRKHDHGSEIITRGLDAPRPITEVDPLSMSVISRCRRVKTWLAGKR